MWRALRPLFRAPAGTRGPSEPALDGEARAIAALLECELLIHELLERRLLQADEMEISLESRAEAEMSERRRAALPPEIRLRVAGILRRAAASLSRIRDA
jgi:hypothetical protein